jgi:co-chaperonin GroES (HSP10)
MDNKVIGYRPIGKRILAEQVYESRETVTGSGIILTVSDAATTELPTDRATVIKIGKAVEEVKIGEVVHYNGRKTSVSFLDNKYILIREEDVHGIIDPQ